MIISDRALDNVSTEQLFAAVRRRTSAAVLITFNVVAGPQRTDGVVAHGPTQYVINMLTLALQGFKTGQFKSEE